MRKLLAALTFLTVIPMPGFMATPEEIARAKPYFPIVGLIIGSFAFLLAILMYRLPPMLAATVIVIFLAMISRCFHLDGLADSADGMMSSRSRERALEIMRDSHIGTMGVFAIVAVLGVKTVAFGTLDGVDFSVAALLAPVLGRYSIVIYCNISHYAREQGLGKAMFENRSWLTVLWATMFSAGICYYFLELRGLILLGIIVIATIWWNIYTSAKLGGATGDTIGANVEFSEMLVPLSLVLLNAFC